MIDDDRSELEKQIRELKEKTEEFTDERDSETLEWKKKYLKDVKGLIQQMNSMKEFQKETHDAVLLKCPFEPNRSAIFTIDEMGVNLDF